MANAQEWLDKNYPKEGWIVENWWGRDEEVKRIWAEKLLLTEPIEGELDLGEFRWLEKVYISTKVDENKLTFKNLPEQAEIIRNSWVDIHEDFIKGDGYGKTYQQKWEQLGLTYQDAKEWIAIWFGLGEYDKVKEWKNRNLKPSDAKPWVEIGIKEYEFATYLKENNYTPTTAFQIKSHAQYWLDYYYPPKGTCIRKDEEKKEHYYLEGINNFGKRRKEITKLYVYNKNFTGSLDVSDFVNLEWLNCSHNKLTNLILPDSLKKLDLFNNPFPCSLDFLSNYQQLKILDIRETNFDEVNIAKLPRSLEEIKYSNNSLIATQLEPIRYGWCKQCQQPNNSYKWCQPCAEKEWGQDLKQLEGQELIEKFIQRQNPEDEDWGLKWIPYEQFNNIKHIDDGGFSKIYRVKWEERQDEGDEEKMVVLKSLNNSSNITLEFLREIANTNLVYSEVSNTIPYLGISQDPETKNYLIVMEYIKEGNLRQYLQNKNNKLSLENKLNKLGDIASGLKTIHDQNLIHRDFHSGNILNDVVNDKDEYSLSTYITDLGLSQLASSQKEEGKIFGVIPYVAPEVLQGQPYTQKSDIYSFGIVAYELLANAYPYPKMDNLAIAVCLGHRPNIDKLLIPQLLKDLIKRCWDANPKNRPSAEELYEVVGGWFGYGENLKKNTPFYPQYQPLFKQYNQFSKSTPYQIHPTATTTSKMIDTKQITELLSKDYFLELKFQNAMANSEITNKLDIDCNSTEELVNKTKRQLSLETQIKTNQGESKLVKLGGLVEEPLEINDNSQNQDWKNINSNFTDELIQSWTDLNFTYPQTQERINIGLQPTDYNFCAWLRDIKKVDVEQVLNCESLEVLNQEFFQWWQQNQFQTNIEQPPK